MINLDQLRDAIDLYRGTVNFTVPLADLPSALESVYTLLLSYNSGSVDDQVANWNLSHPTGVAGLGWTLDRDRIAIEYGDSLGSDQSIAEPKITLRLGGAEYTLAHTGGDPGLLTFAVEPYQFWKITYAPASEKWTVTIEDGTVLTFGDSASGGGTVDWGYAWSNWIGASVNAAGRAQVAVGWSLSTRRDVWGNTITFRYTQTTGSLGTSPAVNYTQASYLSSIVGPDGGSLALAYVDKLPSEYQNPHSGAGHEAWQSRFGTKALSTVTATASGRTQLSVTTLDYTGAGGAVATIGSGNFTKRLLMGITRQVPGGYTVPGLDFTYDENATSPSYGAMLTLTTPAGGTAVFVYQRPTLTLPRRDCAVVPPTVQGVTFSAPRCFFGTDWALALWHGSDNSVGAVAYRWEGRWLASNVVAPATADLNAYNQLQVAIGESSFAILGATTYTLFHTDPNLPGAWIGSSAPEPIGLPAGQAVNITAGDGFVALLAVPSATLILRWFDGQAWQTANYQPIDGAAISAMSSGGEVLALASTPATGADQNIAIVHPDPAAGWIASPFQFTAQVPGVDTVQAAAGKTFAIVLVSGISGANRTASYTAIWWSADYSSVQSAEILNLTLPAAAAPNAIVARGSCVLIGQSVFRFDGQSWRAQDLSTLTHPGQQSVIGLTLGSDVVTRAVLLSSGVVYDTIVYDPTAGLWAYAPNMDGVAAKAGTSSVSMTARFDPAEPDAASRFLLFNNELFLQGGDGAWTSLVAISETFNSTTIASLLLYSSRYLIYQGASGVMAYPLDGGRLGASSGIQIPGVLLTPDNQALAGETAFIAYTGVWGQNAALTLYRPVAEDVRNAIEPLTVLSMTLYGSGGSAVTAPLPYNATAFAYDFGAATATVCPCGRALAANRGGKAVGTAQLSDTPNGIAYTYFFNNLSASETPALPYPTGQWTNAASYLARVARLQYGEQALFATTNAVQYESSAWWSVTTVGAGARKRTAYARCQKIASATDSVPSSQVFTYDPATGLPTQITGPNARGQQMQVAYTYWWQIYDPGRSLNLLLPIVQALESVDGVLVTGSVVTWRRYWGNGTQWAPWSSFKATVANPAAFNAWNTPGPTPSGWVLVDRVNARTPAGLVREISDALGQIGSSLNSGDGFLQIASFANAAVRSQEAWYYGFEPYENAGPWTYRGSTIPAHLVSGEANLGTRSLSIAPDPAGQTGPSATWVPAGQSRAYLFSAWVQTAPNFGSTPGVAQFQITLETVASPPQPVGSPIVLSLPATNGTWQYVSVVIPLGALRAQHSIPPATNVSVTVFGSNAKTGVEVLVDGLRFQPADSNFFASVFQPQTGVALGSLGPNGMTTRLIRDTNRIVTGQVGPELTVAQLSIPSFARLLSPDGTYVEVLPNMQLQASAGDSAVYQNFEASDLPQWTLPAGWTMGNGALTFTGTAPIPGSAATLTSFQSPNYVAYVQYSPATQGANTSVGMGCGNALVYFDAANNNWVLTYRSGNNWVTGATQPGVLGRGDLVFAILDGRISFFSSGRQVLSSVLPQGVIADGKLSLYLTADGGFHDLVALSDPDLKLVMIDGRGIAGQSIDLRDASQVDAWGLIFTSTGLPGYGKNPVDVGFKQTTANLIAGGATSYLPASAGQPPTIAQYVQLGNGSPFLRTVFETAPLSRPAQAGIPGDTFAIGGTHFTTFGYAQNTAAGPMSGLVPPAQAGNYRVLSTVDANAVSSYALASPEGLTVAQRTVLGQSHSLTWGYEYNGAGALTLKQPPNAFAGGPQSGDWNIQFTRDFLGQLTAVSDSDSGSRQLAYDSLGRLRFLMDAVGAAANPPVILYQKFDGLNRIVETGYVSSAAVTWATAQANVDDVAWPPSSLSPVIQATLLYDAAPDNPALTYTEGRLVRSATFSPAGALMTRDTSSYDPRGNVVSFWTEAPDFDSTVWVSTYTYNSDNQVTQIAYPAPSTAGSAPLTVSFAYDIQGRLAAVGQPPPAGFIDPLNPPPDLSAAYAAFTYTPNGGLQTVTYNNRAGAQPLPVAIGYSPANWPVTVASPVYSETVTYTSNGYGNTAYYTGQPASVQRAWKQTPNALFPVLAYTAQYAYDPSGRMTAATPYIAPPPGQQGLPVQYDANSNYQVVQYGYASAAYAYATPSPGNTVQLSNRLLSVTTTAAGVSYGFESAAPAGWAWGTTDGGPGGPTIVDGGPAGSSKCLNVPGGLPGMASYFEFAAGLDPRGQYTLAYDIQADANFGAQPGPAGWYLEFRDPTGPVAAVSLGALANVPATWTHQSLAIDANSIFTTLGSYGNIVEVAVILYNARQAPNGSIGAAVQIDNVSISGSGTTAAIVYDADGRGTSIPNSGLSNIAYAPGSTAVCSFSTAFDGGFNARLGLNDTGEITTCTLTPVPGAVRAAPGSAPPSKLLILRGPDGEPLARVDQKIDGTLRRRYTIGGPQGTFAVEENGESSYFIYSSDDTIRAVMDEQGNLIGYFDRDEFGRLRQAQQPDLDPADLENQLTRMPLECVSAYDPIVGRRIAPATPDAQPAQPTAGYVPGRVVWAFEKARWAASLGWSIFNYHFIKEGPEAMHHHPAWQAFGTGLALFTLPPAGLLSGLGTLALATAPQFLYGLWRHLYINKPLQKACGERGLLHIFDAALVEDIYHLQFYEPLESVGGKKLLSASVAPIADGFYIFVVNDQGDLLYRSMEDRAGGTELYVRHSMLNSGGCARSAGMMRVRGKDILLNNSSGHYAPPLETLYAVVLPLLRRLGYTDYTIRIFDWEEADLKKLMTAYLNKQRKS